MFRVALPSVAALGLVVLGLGSVSPAFGQLAVSANDGKVELVDGAIKYKKDGKDTVSVLDIGATPVKLIAEIPVPASVVGPPSSVAIAPSGEIALVTAAKRTEGDPPKEVSDDEVTVIDLKKSTLVGNLVTKAKAFATKTAAPSTTPEVIATLHAGKGAAGVSINKAGTLALVANRDEGTVSIFTIAGKTVTAAGKVDLGDEKLGPSAIAFISDGKGALVTLDGATGNKIAVLNIDGTKVEFAKRMLTAGVAPYGIDVSSKGDIAIAANMGGGRTGDNDTISVIDLKTNSSRVVNTASVAPSPEGIKISPDGQYVAVSSQNGSNRPKTSPFFHDGGVLAVFRIRGTQLEKVTESPTGHWCQGVVWGGRSNRILVQCMVEQEIQVFSFTGKKLEQQASVKVSAGPAGIRTVEK
jgi:DNA-binding beta-propeller fold protein YncE